MLEHMFDTFGCPPIEQITLEWHHFWHDPRYGAGSSPPVNAMVTMLRRCGYVQVKHHIAGGWPTEDREFIKHDLNDLRFNIVSFLKVDRPGATSPPDNPKDE